MALRGRASTNTTASGSCQELRCVAGAALRRVERRVGRVADGLEAEEGLVAAGIYGYLHGVDNEMAPMFVPADAPRTSPDCETP